MNDPTAMKLTLSKTSFDLAYEKTIINNQFFEKDEYYVQQKKRYFNSLQEILKIPLTDSAKILEIGGGQMALLLNEIFHKECTVADVNENYGKSLQDFNIDFRKCDLLHDDIEDKNYYDLVILCEVIEHMPVPPYIILEKINRWLKPGGWIFLTTPNLYRLRNLLRLALGMRVFDTFLIPEKGKSIGHPIEYSLSQMEWQLGRAGFQNITIELKQLDNAGATIAAQIARILASPLLLRPLWRDKLVAMAQKVS